MYNLSYKKPIFWSMCSASFLPKVVACPLLWEFFLQIEQNPKQPLGKMPALTL